MAGVILLTDVGRASAVAVGIVYEAYGGMRSCYGKSYTSDLQKIADAHGVSAAQVCLRWILDKGAAMAIGTGSNSTNIDKYTQVP